MADKDYWSQLSKKEKADQMKEGYSKDSFNKDMKKLMESSKSNQRLDRQENESMGVVPKPKPRPKTRSTTVEAKKGGLFTRKGPCK